MVEATFLGDDEIRRRLSTLPNSWFSVNALFHRATRVSRVRTYLAVIDLERNFDPRPDGLTRRYLTTGFSRLRVVQQFAQYAADISEELPSKLRNDRTLHFMWRLQLSVYGQLWECLGVQRLIKSISEIAAGSCYNPSVFLDQDPRNSFHNWESIKSTCKSASSDLVTTIDSLYYNRIRNAIAHSEFYIDYPWLFLGDPLREAQREPANKKGPNAKRQGDLQLSTWEMVYKASYSFFICVSAMRRKIESELLERQPVLIELDEFNGPFILQRDERGHWVMAKR
ncbi:MAG: hypothetical protein KAW46_01310 [candidate division Zixibacteria bacterium]|nr:hypothetical protein [candidate division Zixibacteria bacterium]